MGSAGVPAIYMHIIHALLRHPVQRQGVVHRSTAEERARVPAHKRLENAAPGCGLPIGNLSSQFFANVYLDPLDQFVKHVLKAQRYVRYVDDFVLFHHDRAQLERWKVAIERFLDERLKLRLKDDIRLRPLAAGVDFLGYVVYPTHTRVRPRVIAHAKEALATWHRSHRVRGGLEATPADVRALTGTFKVTKRAPPTVTIYSPATGAANAVRDSINGVDVAPGSTTVGSSSVITNVQMAAAATSLNMQAHWVASAEL